LLQKIKFIYFIFFRWTIDYKAIIYTGYALFFMTDAAVKYLDKSDGWELGTAPSIVIVDVGAAGGITTTSAQSDMFAFFFNQKGLMAGLGLQGTKVTKITK